MVKFKCGGCKEEFRISESNLKLKKSISCPNCGQPMNDEVLKNLIAYADAAMKADMYFDKANEFTSGSNTKNSGWTSEYLWKMDRV